MPDHAPNRRPVVRAALAASSLLFVFGLTYRLVAARVDSPVYSTPISPDTLARFPLRIGAWIGEEVPMDEAVIRATGTDAHLNRRYTRQGGLEAVTFYIASGVKARDLMPHRPEVCYTGAGWTFAERQAVALPLSNSRTLPCNIMQFSRGALNTQKVVVLDYYLVDGQYCADVSLLRWKAWRGSGTVRYVAQIEVVAPVTQGLNAEVAVNLVREFATESALLTASLFDDSETSQAADAPPEAPKGQP